jgi:hypothetical protein
VATYAAEEPGIIQTANFLLSERPGQFTQQELAQLLKISTNSTGKFRPEDLPAAFAKDFYVTDYGQILSRPPSDVLLINDGNGRFSDGTEAAGLLFDGWSLAAQACDLNNDGAQDLYVSSDFLTNDRMFINNGAGKFTDQAAVLMRKVPWYSMGVDTGDFNNDGLPDLMTSDMLSKDYKRARRQSPDMYFGRDEMLYDSPQPQMRNMLFANRGSGWMTELGQLNGVAASEWTWSVRFADFDSDGKTEIYASNGMLYDTMDVDFLADFNAKSSRDAVVEVMNLVNQQQPYFTDDFIFTQDDGPYKYKTADNNMGLKDGSMGCGVSLADYDGDGDLDMIMNNTNMPAGVWRNDMPQGGQVLVSLRQDGPNAAGVGARIWLYCGDKTYMDDVIVSRGYATGESGTLHFGVGDAPQIDRLVVRWPDLSEQEYENLAPGKHYTISKVKGLSKWVAPAVKPLFAQSALPFAQKEQDTQRSEFEHEILLPLRCSLWGTGAGTADYDGDGKLDLYFAGAAGQSGQLCKGDGSGGFMADSAVPGVWPAAAEEMAVLWFDANGDGRQDLLVTAGGMEAPAGSDLYGAKLLLNTSQGFTSANLPARLLSTAGAAASDVDGDGDLDLLLSGHLKPYEYLQTVPSALWLNDGKGVFTDATAAWLPGVNAGGQIADAQFADFTGDGRPYLVLARLYGNVELWSSDGKTFTKSGDLTEVGWWRSVGIGDFDNDGDFDLLAGNLGKNTKYSPKPAMPVTTYMADFDKNGVRDAVEVKFAKIDGKDCAMPGRGRSCSGYAIGYIPQRFPTWTSFSNATLDDVYGAGLAGAQKFEATLLTSEVLLNDGTGKFTAEKLPGTAQWAPVFGIAVADFNCDGNLDAFLGNNFNKPQPETGNWQTGYGVLLLGDGKGAFKDVDPEQSGLHLWSDNRSVLAADFTGDQLPDLAVSMSDAQAQLGTRSSEGLAGTPLLVTLTGKAPNTAGIGAQLELELSDGRKLVRTVQAGQGYLGSNSGPQQFALPTDTTASKLTVTWPDGSQTTNTEFSGNLLNVQQ